MSIHTTVNVNYLKNMFVLFFSNLENVKIMEEYEIYLKKENIKLQVCSRGINILLFLELHS